MNEEKDKKKEKGWLKKGFGFAVKAGALTASFVLGGYLGSFVFDYAFYPAVHDTTNQTTIALIELSKEIFGPLHEFVGLTGNDGLLQTEFVQKTLGFSKYYDKAAPANLASKAQENNVDMNDSLDALDAMDSMDSLDALDGLMAPS